MAAVGQAAIDFELPDTDGVVRSLSEFHHLGPLILLFLPTVYGWRPRWQLWSVLRYHDRLVELSTEVVVVTPDPLPELRIFQIRRAFPFIFLYDRGGRVAESYSRGSRKRTTSLVIGAQGIIRYHRSVGRGWRTSGPRLLRIVTHLERYERIPVGVE